MAGESRFELVIFDCDGVLVDSEPIANRVLAECLCKIGLPTTLEESYATYKSRSWSQCLELIQGKLGRPVPEHFAADYYRRALAAYERELEAVPGIHQVLARITTPICVASNGRHTTMQVTLRKTALWERFAGRIYSSMDVPRPKPFPDLYLHAAGQMGAAPARCAVVEDSPSGISAARAAGMTVFGYAGREDPGALSAAGAQVFRAMRDLPALLGCD
ncbi:MAG TPA: HAD family hydrolase [Myxococcota bacterium]|nr:HAD family hydrolase [Myxococcota bacterium]